MNPANAHSVNEYFEYPQNDDHEASTQSQSRLQQVVATVKGFATLSEALRILGAAIMIGGMSVFLMKGWEVGNDIQRYFTLLAQTLLLTAGGFALSIFIKENKGARIFFGLSLVSVTANFTILGALIYSLVQFDGMLTQYPSFATWVVNDASNVFLTLLTATVVLVPVAWFAFAILARSSAKWLTAAYIGVNAMLLIPIRSSLLSIALASLAALVIFALIRKKLASDDNSQTTEGRFARWLLFAPAIIMVFRSWYFYHVDELAVAMLGGLIYLALRQASQVFNSTSKRRAVVDMLAVPLVIAVPFYLVGGIQNMLPSNFELPLFALGIAVLLCDLMTRFQGRIRGALLGCFGSVWICAAIIINEMLGSGFASTTLGLLVLFATLSYGYWIKSRSLFIVCSAGFAYALLINIGDLLRFIDFTNWIFLSALGACAIVAASLLERFGATMKLRFDRMREVRALGSGSVISQPAVSQTQNR